jgi:hypothetical protein
MSWAGKVLSVSAPPPVIQQCIILTGHQPVMMQKQKIVDVALVSSPKIDYGLIPVNLEALNAPYDIKVEVKAGITESMEQVEDRRGPVSTVPKTYALVVGS